jgi:hypothetical protein
MSLNVARRYSLGYFVVGLLACVFLFGANVSAIQKIEMGPKGDSFGVEMTIPGPPPTVGATITSPSNGQSFTELPITVAGICPNDLLVKVTVNGVLAGSEFCVNGSFSFQITLFTGQNELKAYVYDNLDQEGPVSNTVTVGFNNASFTAFGSLITLTSNFARRAAEPGALLTWPLILSGGTGPYAMSIDWGDGTPIELKSITFQGNIDIAHKYKNSGVYQVVIKVTDSQGVSAFLQVTAVATGKPTAGTTTPDKDKTTITQRILLWQPAIVMMILAIPAFWLGRRYELSELRKQIERDAEKYK